MKRFNLLSILILFFTLFGVQSVVGESTYKYGPEKPEKQSDGYYYCIYHSDEIEFGGDNVNYYFYYPAIGNLTFRAKTTMATALKKKVNVSFGIPNTNQIKGAEENFQWSYINNTGTLSKSFEDKTISFQKPEARAIVFSRPDGGTYKRVVTDIKLRMAPHTKLNTESLSFNTALTDPDGETQTIDFYSFLTGSNGMTISIVDENGNPITIEGLSLSKTRVDKNVLEKIGENNYSFTLTFKPKQIITNATCNIKIENLSAEVNPILYIPVTLNSTLEVPTLKLDASGYTFAKLSWNSIEGAESYNVYDNGTKVENNITFNGTSATITGLAYGSTPNYTVASVVGSAISNKSNAIAVNCPAYPIVKNLTASDIQPNRATISWAQEDRIANHSYVEYHILVYENGTLKTDPITTTNTSITLNDLTNTTSYKVKVGVKYQYELNGTQTVSPDKNNANQWVSTDFSTKDPLTEAPYNEPYTGVINYKGTWYYVNLNNDINITSNPMPIKLGYPCNYLTFKAFTESFLGIVPPTNNSVGVKQDGTDPEKAATKEWNSANKEQDGKAEINTTTSDLSIYKYSGNSTEASPLKVKNIWLTIEPHILLKENRFVKILKLNSEKTATSTAEIDFGEIEIGYNKQVNINFKSFLSVGDINAKITVDNNVFSLNEGEKEHYIAGNNTLEEIYSNDHSFTITFNPTEAKEENYTGTLVIKDDKHTVTITLKGKCIKRKPEITWVNDKYISLGKYLAGAAYSTCGIVKYELVDPNNSNIIAIDNDLNLLEGKEKGEVEIIAKVEASDKWEEAESKATFKVTDKIIQSIQWEQNFNALKVGNEIELTAKAITRETNEENDNEITYSIINDSVAKIIDGNKLQVVKSGYTYITAHQQGNNEYAPTDMTKLVFVIETAGDTKNCVALEYEGETHGNGNLIPDGFDWGPFEFKKELTTLGDKLSFETTKAGATTGDYLIITDDLGNLVYNNNLGKTETDIQLPDPEAKELTFTLGGNLKVSISDIKVTPAKYITPDKNSIAFSETKVDNKSIEEIDFDWANQSDFVIATIEDDEAGVFSVDTKTAIFGNPECGEYETSTVKVIFSPKEETNYTANLVLYVDDQPVPQKIPITGQGKKAEQSIYWLNISNLTTADKEINLAHTSASTQQPITYTIISDVNDVVQLNDDHTITIIGAGTFTLQAQQMGNDSYEETAKTKVKEFTATIGNLIFDNKEKNNEWTTIRNWKPESRLNLRRNIAPSEDVEINLLVSAPLIIKNNTEVETNKQLSIEAGKGTVTVEPQGRLTVNTIDGTNGDNLTLQSSSAGNGAFVFASGTPSATVEIYSKAEGGVIGGTPQWQYMGVAVDGATASNFPNSWLLKWTEAESAVNGDPWSDRPLEAGTTLTPWAGYSISQPTAATYSMKGTLMNSDHRYELSYTQSDDPDCGFNLLANSYTAPIDITKLTEDDFVNADACIILYNTGTYAQWEEQTSTLGDQPGQLTVIPVATGEATGLPTTIASMQAFFVKANTKGATFTINYNTDVAGATEHDNQMRAPRAEKEFNVLKITIEGENTRDRLFLIENEETTNAYDNGYEARKIFDAPRGHQMYATCEYGYASIDCSESIVGQTIGLKGDNEGEMLTISFDTDRLEGYQSLYLYDKVTGKYINILSGEKYTFFGVKGTNDNRFSIVTNPDDKAQTPPFVVIGDELAFDKSQINTENANIYIYDTSGRLLMTNKINPHENYNIPNMPNGVYLVSMNGYTTKIVKK